MKSGTVHSLVECEGEEPEQFMLSARARAVYASFAAPAEGDAPLIMRIERTDCVNFGQLAMINLPFMHGMRHLFDKFGVFAASLEFANENDVILVVAHLYKIAKSAGLFIKEWQDMDLVIANHSTRKVPLVTKPPTNADPYTMARFFQIALGASISHVKSSKRPAMPTANIFRSKRRKLNHPSRFFEILKTKYKHRQKLSDGILDAVLRELADEDSKLRKGVPTDRQLSAVELLTAFRKSLVADDIMMNLDYIGFTKLCFRIWLAVALALKVPVPFHRLEEYFEKHDAVPSLVDNILWDTAKAVDRTGTAAGTSLAVAAKRMQQILMQPVTDEDAIFVYNIERVRTEGQGDMDPDLQVKTRFSRFFSKDAFEQTSERIPKHMRPDIVDRGATTRRTVVHIPAV